MDNPLYSLIAACVLAAIYAILGRAGRAEGAERFWAHRRWVSAAAGVSVAYVFIDVLPDLAAQNRALREAMGGIELRFAEQRVYVLVLLSFVVMYGLEHMVLASRERRRAFIAGGERDAVYWLHLGGFAAYSALIGYLLSERAERGAASLAVYTLAMAVHFVIVNHSLSDEHSGAYRGHGHWWLAGSVIVGWALGALVPISEVAFARLFALLAGGVVITSLNAELPGERAARFWPFCMGAVVFALLLLMA
jgi:hypothetical protein